MLEFIRKRSASWIVKLLLLLLVLSFGLWGIGDVLSPNPNGEWAAKVGGVVVSDQVLRDEYQNELRRLRQVLGDNIDQEQAGALGLPAHALEQIVNRTLLDLGANDLGVVVSDNVLRQAVQANPIFHNPQGMFDKQLFDHIVRNSGLNETTYLETLRGEMIRRQLVGSVLAGSAPPQLLADEIYRYRNEKRVVTYLPVPNTTMTQVADADETTLRSFYADNISMFTAPEYRSVTAIILAPEDLTSEVSITEQELQTAFHDRSADFGEPERRALDQIVFTDKDVGERALVRISEGTDFAVVAKENADLGPDEIKLGIVNREQVLPELADVAFNLPEGGVSELVESPLGWHLIRVTSIYPARQQQLDDVRDQLQRELTDDKAIDALIELSARLEDALGGGATLEEAAVQINTKTIEIEALDHRGLNPSGSLIPHLPGGFVDTAFSTSENSESSLIEANDGSAYFVLRVDRITPAAPKPFEVARNEVEKEWIAVKRKEAAEATANAIAERVKQGLQLSAAASENGLDMRTTQPFSRSGEGASEGLDPNLIGSAFQAEPESTFVVKGQNASFVARVTAVTVADPASDPQEVAALSQGLRNTGNNDLLSQLNESLAQRYPVEINNQSINQLY